jgi:hypothetical protein
VLGTVTPGLAPKLPLRGESEIFPPISPRQTENPVLLMLLSCFRLAGSDVFDFLQEGDPPSFVADVRLGLLQLNKRGQNSAVVDIWRSLTTMREMGRAVKRTQPP